MSVRLVVMLMFEENIQAVGFVDGGRLRDTVYFKLRGVGIAELKPAGQQGRREQI